MFESDVPERFKSYVIHRMPEASDVEVNLVGQIFGGASRQTYSLELKYTLKGEQRSRRVILRREAETGLIDTNTAHEYKAFKAFHGTDVPIPEPLWHEEDKKWLDQPFVVIEEITDCEAAPNMINQWPYNEVREKIGHQFCKIMASIASTDPADVGLHNKLEVPAPDACWKKELDYWENDLNKNELEPQPLVRAAIRWLRKNPPPPAQRISVVHGDMRIGNFLYNEAGTIRGILDWEMMHIGDPLEDLGYSLNPLWTWDEQGFMGFMLPRDQAVTLWEEASGLKADPDALHWWEVMASVKSVAIWVSSAKIYADCTNMDPIIAFAALWAGDIQQRALLKQMRGES